MCKITLVRIFVAGSGITDIKGEAQVILLIKQVAPFLRTYTNNINFHKVKVKVYRLLHKKHTKPILLNLG